MGEATKRINGTRTLTIIFKMICKLGSQTRKDRQELCKVVGVTTMRALIPTQSSICRKRSHLSKLVRVSYKLKTGKLSLCDARNICRRTIQAVGKLSSTMAQRCTNKQSTCLPSQLLRRLSASTKKTLSCSTIQALLTSKSVITSILSNISSNAF